VRIRLRGDSHCGSRANPGVKADGMGLVYSPQELAGELDPPFPQLLFPL
jgi:hypothetical protein